MAKGGTSKKNARSTSTGHGSTDVPSLLQLGWKMAASSGNEPLYLRAKGLPAHMAVIAQSGSGKSFMLGRMLEEIAGKTLARFLILDPNSDFVKFSVVDNDAWQRRTKEGHLLTTLK
jgi:hypothetical protein